MKPTVIIDLIKDAPRRFPGRRPQPWRYLITNAGNHRVMERSSENLTNRDDAIEAIEDVHGPDTTVVLRQPGQPDKVIREPQKQYPVTVGGIVSIGPACYAEEDGSLLNWRGVNYVPQLDPPSRRVELSEHEARELVAAVQNSDLAGAVVHHPRVLQRVIEMLNTIITQHENHIHTATSGWTDVIGGNNINSQEDPS